MHQKKTKEEIKLILEKYKADPDGFRDWAEKKGISRYKLREAFHLIGKKVPRKMQGMHQKTKEKIKLILEQYEADPEGLRSWAEDNGISRYKLREAFHLIGKKVPRKKQGMYQKTKEDTKLILEQYEADPDGFRDWAEKKGFGRGKLARAFATIGQQVPKRKLRSSRIFPIIKGLMDGKSYAEIGREVSCSRQYVEQVAIQCKQEGIL